MSYQVKTEKVIGRPVADVFQALKEGVLFVNCNSEYGTMKIDFRVGGKYLLDMRDKVNFGEFLEIVPNKKIVFSWCQNFGPDQKPDTQVTIELFEDGAKTRLSLLHSGFTDQQSYEGHSKGWTSVINDFAGELEKNQIRMTRAFKAAPETIREICLNIIPNQLQNGNVTLNFNKKDDGTAMLEIIHAGLKGLAERKARRTEWEVATKKIRDSL